MPTDPILDIFREEAREHLGALEKGFLDLESAASVDARRGLINELFRHAHSLRGDARAVGLTELHQTAQVLEDLLDHLREHPEKVGQPEIDQGLAQFDVIRRAFENWQNEAGQVRESPVEEVESSPDDDPEFAIEEEPKRKAQVERSKSEESFTVRVPSERLDRMLSLAGELRIAHRAGDELAKQIAALQEQVEELATTDFQSPIEGAKNRQSEIGNWKSLQSAISEGLRRLEGDIRKKRTNEQLMLEALETDIRQARLLPLRMLADSLRRAVRDLAQSLGKAIRYEVEVGDVLLDKAVIEALKDPLLPLIRNAADHGIETADERRAVGKPEEATIRIGASRRGELVQITVTDDGRGVDYDRIRERVAETHGIDPAELAELSEKELGGYLFQPGFTTRTVSDTVSGRGVGLDVVRDTVHRLQGNVELLPIADFQLPMEKETNRQSGTTFAITVPVTISTVRILTITNEGQYYGVPSSAIVRTGRVRYEDLRELEGNLILTVDGEPVRWVHLCDLFGTAAPVRPTNGSQWPYLLLASDAGRQTVDERNGPATRTAVRLAVAVDDMEEESEVLLKPLGYPLSGMPGIVGATIRPDGSVQLVLDLGTIARRAGRIRSTPTPAELKPTGRILVVDDSPTTRAILRNVFSAAGYSVRTAIDGVDAMNTLQSHLVDLVVSDIQMPRMNGFELTQQIKSQLGLPVILVTAMEREEHKRQGLEAGADAYVVKSTFEGAGLLEVVKQFV